MKSDVNEMEIDHIDTSFEGVPCEVYFFESWTTYSHPVQPTGPMYFEQAVVRSNHYRAWMTREGEERRFVLFEAITVQHEPTELPVPQEAKAGEPITAFAVNRTDEALSRGKRLQLAEILKAEEYLLSTGDARVLTLVSQETTLRYRYHYRPDGSLAKVEITNPEGAMNVLEY